jgi:hypothetical protein
MRTFEEIKKEYQEACTHRAIVIRAQIASLEKQLEAVSVFNGILPIPAVKPNGAAPKRIKRPYTKKSKFWKKK